MYYTEAIAIILYMIFIFFKFIIITIPFFLLLYLILELSIFKKILKVTFIMLFLSGLSLILYARLSEYICKKVSIKSGYDCNGIPLSDIDISHLNPNPKQRYKLIVEVKDAPGLFNVYGGGVTYTSPNCKYRVDHFNEGSFSPSANMLDRSRHIKLDIVRVDDTRYEGIFDADAILEEDVYGQGICKWEVQDLGFGFAATGEETETSFRIGSSFNKLLEKKQKNLYYLKEDYPITYDRQGNIFKDGSDSGRSIPEYDYDENNKYEYEYYKNEPKYKREDFFTIKMRLEED